MLSLLLKFLLSVKKKSPTQKGKKIIKKKVQLKSDKKNRTGKTGPKKRTKKSRVRKKRWTKKENYQKPYFLIWYILENKCRALQRVKTFR